MQKPCGCGCGLGAPESGPFRTGHRAALLKALAAEAAPLAFAGLDHSIYRAAWIRASGESDRPYIRWVAKLTRGCARPPAADRVGVDGAPLEIPIEQRKALLARMHETFWVGREVVYDGLPATVVGVPCSGLIDIRQGGRVLSRFTGDLKGVPMPTAKTAVPICEAGHQPAQIDFKAGVCRGCQWDRRAAIAAVGEELNAAASAAERNGRDALRLRSWDVERRLRRQKRERAEKRAGRLAGNPPPKSLD